MTLVQPIRVEDQWYWEQLNADLASINDNGTIKVTYEDCGIDAVIEVRLKDLWLAVAPEFADCKEYKDAQ